jgi:hypothetical protein
MTIPAIARGVLDTPGDIRPRPHANCYWLIPGEVLAGEHPSSTASAVSAARIDAILDAGMRQFVDLTAEAEDREPYAPILLARAVSRDLRVAHRRFAIVDFGVPTAALMRSTLDAIYGAIDAREAVYLHCWGGVGRTGTVVGCLLREQGCTAREALDILERKWEVMEKRTRHPRSPETGGQIEFIERWPGG